MSLVMMIMIMIMMMIMMQLTIKVMVMVMVVMVNSCRGNPKCRSGVDQVQTRWRPDRGWADRGPTPAWSPLGLPTPGLQFGFPRQAVTITTITITVIAIIIINVTKITI